MLAVEREAYRGPVYDFTVPGEHAFLAEGVVVHNCGPCKAADGKRYATLADVAVDFPVAGRFDCLGTTRCRCVVVAVYES